jgi:hypothetical protein
VGMLRIENAIVLLEVGEQRHAAPLGVQLGLLGVYIATVAFFRFYLKALGREGAAADEEPSSAGEPTL